MERKTSAFIEMMHGLAIIKSKSARLLDKTRKELHKIFEQFDLKITAEVNMNVVNFLDVTFDLINAKHKPCRKPNDDPLYINRHSNHPPSITRQLPTAINKRIALLSSDEQTFKESTPIYQNALRHSNFDHEFTYTQDAPQRTRRNRQRNIIWFNTPFKPRLHDSHFGYGTLKFWHADPCFLVTRFSCSKSHILNILKFRSSHVSEPGDHLANLTGTCTGV